MNFHRSVWIDAERIGEHVHVKVSTGTQHGQPDKPTYGSGPGHANNAGALAEQHRRQKMAEGRWKS